MNRKASCFRVDPYVQVQVAARSAGAVVKARLLNLRSKYPRGLIIAVEGPEDKVACSHWIARTRPALAYEFLVCGGKPQVRHLKNASHRDLAGVGADLIFLVDRDFDDLEGFDEVAAVAMTEKYSIENYVVDEDVLGRSLRVAYPCDGQPALREQICRLFNADYRSFLDIMSAINFRIFVAKRLGMRIDEMIPRSIDGLVTIQLGGIAALQHDPDLLISFSKQPDADTFQALSEEFQALDPPARDRGKFAYKFLQKWLDRLAYEFRNGELGLFGHLPAEAGGIHHVELGLGPMASRSPIPSQLAEVLPQ